jgi:hypothetical protein
LGTERTLRHFTSRMSGTRLLVAGLACAALFACGGGPADEERDASEGELRQNAGDDSVEPPPDADLDASLDLLGEDPPRPGEEPELPRFVGRWAATEAQCGQEAWRFTPTQLTTPAGSVCLFEEVRVAPGGYDIAARCTAEAPEREDEIRLRFPQSAGGMTFESASIADAGLVRCGNGG